MNLHRPTADNYAVYQKNEVIFFKLIFLQLKTGDDI
jgi:hypothetical protein